MTTNRRAAVLLILAGACSPEPQEPFGDVYSSCSFGETNVTVEVTDSLGTYDLGGSWATWRWIEGPGCEASWSLVISNVLVAEGPILGTLAISVPPGFTTSAEGVSMGDDTLSFRWLETTGAETDPYGWERSYWGGVAEWTTTPTGGVEITLSGGTQCEGPTASQVCAEGEIVVISTDHADYETDESCASGSYGQGAAFDGAGFSLCSSEEHGSRFDCSTGFPAPP